MKIAKELILIPIIFLIFSYLVANAYGYVLGDLARILFPTSNDVIQGAKVYFTVTIFFVAIEFFVSSKMPNNYLFSRMLAMLFMMSLYIILYNYYIITLGLNIVILLLGSIVALAVQTYPKIKYDNVLGIVIFLSVFTYILINTL